MNTTLAIDMTHLPNSIPLGRCGENHTVICFDCTSYLETYGEGSAALLFQPAQGSMHPVVVEQTGALVTWRVSASDTAASGSGLCELSWYVDDMLAKSQQMSTVVYAALSERADTACQAASRPWMDQIVQASANAQRAQAAAETAQSIADGMGAVYVKQSGGKLSGNLDAQSHTISNLQAPAAGRDAATKQYVDDARAACLSADALQTAVLDMFYPVGTLYHTTASAFDPAAAWGGTWERIKDRFLLAAGTAYAGGSTGGEATHKLTAQEMPSHTLVSDSRRVFNQTGRCHDQQEKLSGQAGAKRRRSRSGTQQHAAVPRRVYLETDCLSTHENAPDAIIRRVLLSIWYVICCEQSARPS